MSINRKRARRKRQKAARAERYATNVDTVRGYPDAARVVPYGRATILLSGQSDEGQDGFYTADGLEWAI